MCLTLSFNRGYHIVQASRVTQWLKNNNNNNNNNKPCLPLQEMQETWFQSWVGKIPLEEEMATPPAYPYRQNPIGRGAWWATVHRVTESQTRLSDWARTSRCPSRQGSLWAHMWPVRRTPVLFCLSAIAVHFPSRAALFSQLCHLSLEQPQTLSPRFYVL